MLSYMSDLQTRCLVASVAWSCLFSAQTQAADTAQFREHIQPMLVRYCFDCHAGDANEGGVVFDADDQGAWVRDRMFWKKVLRNVRADLMPPKEAQQPTPDEKKILEAWISSDVFEIDPDDPSPGEAALRRLNRTEYRNTVRDLLGVDFNAEIVFPPDDTGHGFDTISEAMSISPMLLEKYLEAAKSIVDEAVPIETWVVPSQRFGGREFLSDDKSVNGSVIHHDRPATVQRTFEIQYPGTYRISIREKSHGSFEFHPGRYHVAAILDGAELHSADYQWEENRESRFETTLSLEIGTHALQFQLTALPPLETDEVDLKGRFVSYELASVTIEGPTDGSQREHPRGYTKVFDREEPPTDAAERRIYATDILTKFVTKAYRRPATPHAIARLLAIAESVYQRAGMSFESGIRQAYMAVLASPQFLFRLEDVETLDESSRYPRIDEYALASRLSYLLWSSMPDDRLRELADAGELRRHLSEQVQRMIRDPRSDEFIRSFAGQWLRARDVEHVSIDPIAALGYQQEYERLRTSLIGKFRRPRRGDPPLDPETEKGFARLRELGGLRDRFDASVRIAMRRETEMAFEYVVRHDRSLLELLDSDYVFVNESLARLYQLEGVQGNEMRQVSLPEGSPRGGVLTQGTMLTVTSNPTRTSPVKRGLYILENILGTPSPPAPPNVPTLEDSADRFGGRTPTLRELLAVHREAALCSSCHSRMDPLGLALENFNAIGSWRDTEGELPIDSVGELITGEPFRDIKDLKRILVTTRRTDYYRCVTEKLLVYALGRGLEYDDDYSVEQIVQRLEQGQGTFGILLEGIVRSAPFQRRAMRSSASEPSH